MSGASASGDDPRDALAAALGILPEYEDQTGKTHRLSPATRDALLAAMGQPIDHAGAHEAVKRRTVDDAARPLPEWKVVEADLPLILEGLRTRRWRLETENGDVRDGEGPEIGALAVGIHALDVAGSRCWLLSAPKSLPEPPRTWGVTLPLYGLGQGSRIGTYADLGRMAAMLAETGADFVGVNPIHAGFFTDPATFSPYSPAHRAHLSTMYLDAGQKDVAGDTIDYAAGVPDRLRALSDEWNRQGSPDAPEDWTRRQGSGLEQFVLHQALSEAFGGYWPDWPEALHDPKGAAAQAFAEDHADDLRRHRWLQWRADRALGDAQQAALDAGMRFGLYLDLAVGTHPAGAETWAQPDLFARNVSLGAPPDFFSSAGQSWGLAPLRPDVLARDGFRPLAAILRRQLAHARLLRIDHVLGFERAFWVPDGGEVPGAYVQMPKEAMLAVIRIEAARAGAAVVGEDLGNIPQGLQNDLTESGILGCRVVMFEQDWDTGRPQFRPASDYARAALTSFGTHDLPTWEGWKRGRDIEWREQLGVMDAAGAAKAKEQRRAEVDALIDMLGSDDADTMHAFLAKTPSRLVAVQGEDVLNRMEQPNLPGTVDTHPNWRRPLGVTPDDPGWRAALARISAAMRDAGRQES
ncbi:hypothetical protein OCGS_0741 [Oceaniovalibus guishaninsula JLT2003]|uniref:4-alpha-glucanotransferase n=1 Tax=Oceaniovalibus guishaninsula JLT2003 TaxID=1231392 RepID=K2GR14_9RHOB|nr:4-alpha-glucanotransferase [Oceaniovalibus guishaninsula]EKE45046.1 hypothetical protein OCGS_0741 [Oceaniovalibus guishaninsula JLT2003]